MKKKTFRTAIMCQYTCHCALFVWLYCYAYAVLLNFGGVSYKSTYNSYSFSQPYEIEFHSPKPSKTVHRLHSHLNPFPGSVKVILKGDFESFTFYFSLEQQRCLYQLLWLWQSKQSWHFKMNRGLKPMQSKGANTFMCKAIAF